MANSQAGTLNCYRRRETYVLYGIYRWANISVYWTDTHHLAPTHLLCYIIIDVFIKQRRTEARWATTRQQAHTILILLPYNVLFWYPFQCQKEYILLHHCHEKLLSFVLPLMPSHRMPFVCKMSSRGALLHFYVKHVSKIETIHKCPIWWSSRLSPPTGCYNNIPLEDPLYTLR